MSGSGFISLWQSLCGSLLGLVTTDETTTVGNRAVKVKLWERNPHCHWCGIPTILTNNPDGVIPDDAATVDHLISRYNPTRWVQKSPYEIRKVLSCAKCNKQRSYDETQQLSREEIQRRSRGYSLNPRRRPFFKGNSLPTISDVVQYLKEKGVDILRDDVNITTI